MKVIKRSCDLPIAVLHAHPDNPRKDVGDVTELAESIKQNGIFQNLTVVKGGKGSPNADGYTVIIGHRRLTAAARAGLTKVPCMVVDMDDKEQLSTMLLENMQRNDLTIWEQAQGFQMMLDLGETEDDICKKTGFAKQTVRHRLKLLELDPVEFKKAQQRQPTLNDYIALEKIENINERNKVLKDIGTNNFQWSLNNAIRKQENKHNTEAWNKFIKSLDIPEISDSETNGRLSLNDVNYYITAKLETHTKKAIKDLIEKNPGCSYSISKWGNFNLYGDEKEEKQQAKPQWKIDAEKREARVAKVKEIEQQARELRDKFVKGYVGTSKDIKYLVCQMLSIGNIELDSDAELIAEYLGIKLEDPDIYDIPDLIEDKRYLKILGKQTQRVLLAQIAADCQHCNFHDFYGYYEKNEYLDGFYKIISNLGYGISEQERKLINGTHECFEPREDTEVEQ